MTRLLLLDMDGIINLKPSKEASAAHLDLTATVVRTDLYEEEVHYSPEVVKQLVAIINSQADIVRVKWLTAWQQNTQLFPTAIGTPSSWGWLRSPEAVPENNSWKIDVVRNRVTPSYDSILWVDDRIVFEPEALKLAQDSRLNVLSPPASTGLTALELERITDWACG